MVNSYQLTHENNWLFKEGIKLKTRGDQTSLSELLVDVNFITLYGQIAMDFLNLERFYSLIGDGFSETQRIDFKVTEQNSLSMLAEVTSA